MQVGFLNSSILTQGENFMKAGQPYQSPRQRVWTAIRKNQECFSIKQVAGMGNMKYESAREFVSCLEKAGIVEIISTKPVHHENCVVKQKLFKLVRDLGFNVPTVSKSGEIQCKQTGTKAMWNTLRITKKASLRSKAMFATLEAMTKKFGERKLVELTDNEQPYQDVINLDKLNAAMNEANSEIEGYIAARYSLPLQTVPPFLESLACHMARYHACTGAMSDNDPIKTRYENAVKSLKEISKGVIQLGGSPVGESAPVKTSNNSVVMTIGRHDFGGRGW